MKEEISAISDIREYVLNLKSKNDQKKNEIISLNEKVTSLNSEIKEFQSAIDEMKEQIKMLKLAKKIDGEDNSSSKEVKLMINEMVREIDKCIALLNK